MAQQKTKPRRGAQQSIADDKLKILRKWNLWLAAIFAIQAAVIAIIGTTKTAPITTNYLAADPLASEATGEQILAVATRTIFDVRIAWLVAACLLAFAMVYVLAATVFRKRYELRLQSGMNDFRWIGIGVGGGLMFALVTLLSGLQETTSLLMIFTLMVAGAIAVLCAEEIARREGQKRGLLSHVICGVATVCVIVPWIVVAKAAGGTWLYDGHTPGYLWGIYATMLVFFIAGFLLTHFRIKRRGMLANTLRTEQAYMLLSLLAVSVLAWQVFAGTLRP